MYSKWINQIKKNELFSNIEQQDLLSMLSCLCPNITSYKKKNLIALSDDSFKGIGIILDGTVILTKEGITGNRNIMAKLHANDMFGEVIAFSGFTKWTVTIEALTDCTIMFLPPHKIVHSCPSSCGSHTTLIENMLSIISKKALHLNRKLEYLTIKTIRSKLCSYIYELYNTHNSLTIKMPLNRNELAQFLNITRPSLSRELINLKNDGIIDYDKHKIKILDLDAMNSFAE